MSYVPIHSVHYPQLDFFYSQMANGVPQQQQQQQQQQMQQQPQQQQQQQATSLPQTSSQVYQQFPSIYVPSQQSTDNNSYYYQQQQFQQYQQIQQLNSQPNQTLTQGSPQLQNQNQSQNQGQYYLPNHNLLPPHGHNQLQPLLPHPHHILSNQNSSLLQSKPSSMSSNSSSTSYMSNYPISPQSIHDHYQSNNKEDHLSLSPHNNLPIDYSSIVSYTISPLLKRRRKSKQKKIIDAQDLAYPCPQCSKVFQKPYNLKSHMKSHSNEKPFKCSSCHKTFARSHDKKRHELLHGGQKNFKCEGYLKNGVTKWGCGKKFARSDALSRHFRTETGWLCIKPLMDEAKELDQNLSLNHNHYHQNDGKEEYDNSSLIRKLIQSK